MPERFETEVPSLDKYAYIPFYEGKRKCLGYNLADLSMKLLIGNIIDKYETKVEEDYKMCMALDAVYCVQHPYLMMKLK